MNTKINRHQATLGASLVTVMIICGIISFSVVGYLALITQQSTLSARSQTWNMAIAISEAGIEEGLEQLNSNSGNLNTSPWVADGATYSLTRSFAGGNSYTVVIDNSAPANPTITSRAYINLSTFAQNAPSAYLAAAGVTLDPNQSVTRAVRVTTSRGSLFLASMVAKKGIDLKGNGVMTDSFDSGSPALSTNGHYDPTKTSDRGDVASNDGIVGVVSVQNANIYGHVHTGKGGTVSIGSQGSVGSHAWQTTNKGIQPGWATEDANFTFPDTTVPFTVGLPIEVNKEVLTAVGTTTNTTYVNGATTYPGAVPTGATMSAVVTNNSTLTTSVYPGPQPGITTNISYTTTSSYPGNITGLVTNNAGFTTVGSYPGPQPGLTTNYNGGRNKITGYTYATSFNYTYPSMVYSYNAPTYTYNLSQTTPLYTTNHYDNYLNSGDYVANSLSGTVYVNGHVRLALPDGLSMSGNDQFVLGPLGSIEIYAGGNSITIGGNGVLNPNGFAGNFIVYCAPSVTSFTLNGNGEFVGVLVAPNADITMNGGGNSDQDFIGALMVNSVSMNGHFKFHYDEALSRMAANGRFLITSWDEVK